jgi:hypothetical protein
MNRQYNASPIISSQHSKLAFKTKENLEKQSKIDHSN